MRAASFITLAITFASVLLLSACGQKGPLYLPQDAQLPATATEQPPAALADEAESKQKSAETAAKR